MLSFTGVARPRILFLPTAAGDDQWSIERFDAAFGPSSGIDCDSAVLPLFDRSDDVAGPIGAADAIVVAGGNTANLLAIWRLHGIIDHIRAAYDRGTVLSGWSAGCICWFTDGITDSYGPTLRPLGDGLGFLDGSACPHYDGEPTRRPTYLEAIRTRRIVPGYAMDDGVGLLFADEQLVEAVSPRPDGRAFRVDRDGEHPLAVRWLG